MNKPPQRRFQISLRATFGVLLACAVLLAIPVRYVHLAQRQQATVSLLERVDEDFFGYEPQPEWVPDWLFKRLGPDYFCRVVGVSVGSELPHELRRLSEMPGIETLTMNLAPEGAAEAGQVIQSLPHLRVLVCSQEVLPFLHGKTSLVDLSVENWAYGQSQGACLTADERSALESLFNLQHVSVGVSDGELGSLAKLQRLESLSLHRGPFAKGLLLLRDLPALTELDFGGSTCNDTTLEYVAELSRIASLTSRNDSQSAVTNQGVKSLSRLPRLRVLTLQSDLIDDGAIPFLEKMPALKRLQLSWAKLSAAGVKRLSEARPDLEIRIYSGRADGTGNWSIDPSHPTVAPGP